MMLPNRAGGVQEWHDSWGLSRRPGLGPRGGGVQVGSSRWRTVKSSGMYGGQGAADRGGPAWRDMDCLSAQLHLNLGECSCRADILGTHFKPEVQLLHKGLWVLGRKPNSVLLAMRTQLNPDSVAQGFSNSEVQVDQFGVLVRHWPD